MGSDVIGHIEGRKFIDTAMTTAALISIACGAAAYALLDHSHLAAPTSSVQNLSVHVSHDGRALRPGHIPLLSA
jgi:hypothetical protein